MNYEQAVAFLGAQERNLRKINNVRFMHKGYEYRLKYEGGFAAFFAIERREVGKRNFKYYKGFGAYHCWNAQEALKMAMDEIEKTGKVA